jgi:hypothetical protein
MAPVAFLQPQGHPRETPNPLLSNLSILPPKTPKTSKSILEKSMAAFLVK